MPTPITRRFRLIWASVLLGLGTLVPLYAQTPEATPVAVETVAPSTNNAHPPTVDGGPGNDANRYGGLMKSQQTPQQPKPPDLTRIGVATDRTLSMSLNDAIRRALENNNDIEIARDSVRLQEANLRGLLGVYDPVFSFSPQYSRSTRSQGSALSGAGNSGTLSSSDFQFNGSVDKLFEKNGMALTFFSNNDRQTTGSSFSTFSPLYNTSLGVQFSAPLLRGRTIDNNRRQIRIQRKVLEQSDADFRRLTIDVITQVQNAYWDLVFALRDQEIRVSNLNLTRENLRQVEARISAGDAAPLARAEVLTELANRESDVLVATQTVSTAENNLKQLIFRDAQTPDWSAQLMPTDAPAFNEAPVNLNDALTEARANRPEMRRLQLARDITDVNLEYFRDQLKPRVDITANYANTGLAGSTITRTATTSSLVSTDPALVNLNADAYLLSQINALRVNAGLPPITVTPQITSTPSVPPSDLTGGYGRAFRNALDFGTREFTLGVTIQIPLRNRTAEANLAATNITRHQIDTQTRQTEQQIELEVRNAAQALETARRRVFTAREALKNAELQLAGEQKLYQVGRSTTFLLFQRENALANARNQELRAETDYNKALANLQHAT